MRLILPRNRVSEHAGGIQDVTIKKLTRGNPTMAAKFAELGDGADS
jgi:hypothetical protein